MIHASIKRHAGWLFYPLLVACFPVLSLYSLNEQKLMPSNIVVPIVISLAIAGTLMLVFGLIFRDRYKGALITALCFFYSMFFGQGLEMLRQSMVGRYLYEESRYYLVAVSVLVVFLMYRVIKKRSDIATVTRLLNVTAVCLLIYPFFLILKTGFHRAPLFNPPAAQSAAEPSSVALGSATPRPDIYYIILDGYGRQDTLQQYYHFDNSPFIDFLKSHGFYVMPQSRCNYGVTLLSLASSLNMSYLDSINGLPDQENLGTADIRNSAVIKEFKSLGYQSIHFASGWVVTNQKQPMADITYDCRAVNEFSNTLMRTSLACLLISDKVFTNSQREFVRYNLKKVTEVPYLPGPKFTFVHVVCPHPPFVFDREGNVPPRTRKMKILEADWLPRERYIDQLYYLNTLVENTISLILSRSKTPPIILVQGDHGPACDGMDYHPAVPVIRQRVAILNAFYLPGNAAAVKRLYPSISPVNSFRLILDSYFGEHLEFLKDRCNYCGPLAASPYTYLDVTDFQP